MEELNIKKNQKRKEQLEYAVIILMIICGSFLDLFDYIASQWLYGINQWSDLHNLCRELRLLGFSLFLFKVIRYDQIKLKALSFMFIIWSSVIIVYNTNLPQTHSSFFTTPLYFVYTWWLIRILLIKEKYPDKQEQFKLVDRYSPHNTGVAYNILMPVSTFRGLLQILFSPFANPLYETRILVARRKIIAVQNKVFVELPYSESYVKSLIRRGGKIRACRDFRWSKIEHLIGKKLFFTVRDCRKLEI